MFSSAERSQTRISEELRNYANLAETGSLILAIGSVHLQSESDSYHAMRACAIARPRPRPSVFSFALRGLLLLARGGLGREDELLPPHKFRNFPGNPLPCTRTNTSCVQKTGVPIRFDAGNQGKNAEFLRHQYQSWEVDNFRLWRGIFQRNLRNDTVVATVDIGAWIGTTAIWLAAHSDLTLAFEPSPSAYDQLRRNARANTEWLSVEDRWPPRAGGERETTAPHRRSRELFVVNAAVVGGEDGRSADSPSSRRSVYVSDRGDSMDKIFSGSSLESTDGQINPVRSSGDHVPVPAVPVAEVLRTVLQYADAYLNQKSRLVLFIKVDTEGFETEIVPGLVEALGSSIKQSRFQVKVVLSVSLHPMFRWPKELYPKVVEKLLRFFPFVYDTESLWQIKDGGWELLTRNFYQLGEKNPRKGVDLVCAGEPLFA